MTTKNDIYDALKARGLAPEQEEIIEEELRDNRRHAVAGESTRLGDGKTVGEGPASIYQFYDLIHLQAIAAMRGTYSATVRSIDELLERDRLREKDGFPRKVNVGRLIKPSKGGKAKVVIVPTTVEEKLIHDPSFKTTEKGEGDSSGGVGEGEEGEVIGEQPVRSPEGEGAGPGEGEGGGHEMESDAYDLGKILTEKFALPNLKDKGKKRSLTRYTYDLTDKHRGFGQFLDKKATLRQIVETNIHLGNIPDLNDIDPTGFLISPADRIFRILSREKDYESQALVFFVRDYSGSMTGKVHRVGGCTACADLQLVALSVRYAGRNPLCSSRHRGQGSPGFLHLLQFHGGRWDSGCLSLPSGQFNRGQREPGQGLQHLRFSRHGRGRLGHRR